MVAKTVMTKFVIGFCLGALIGSFVATAIEMLEYRARVRQLVQERMQIEAVISGHAEWLEGPDGNPVFSWKRMR